MCASSVLAQVSCSRAWGCDNPGSSVAVYSCCVLSGVLGIPPMSTVRCWACHSPELGAHGWQAHVPAGLMRLVWRGAVMLFRTCTSCHVLHASCDTMGNLPAIACLSEVLWLVGRPSSCQLGVTEGLPLQVLCL